MYMKVADNRSMTCRLRDAGEDMEYAGDRLFVSLVDKTELFI